MLLCFILYKYLDIVKPNVNWGSAAHAYRCTCTIDSNARYLAAAVCRHIIAVQNLYKLEETKDHVKNYRPQYLVLIVSEQLLCLHLLKEQIGQGEYTDPSAQSLVRFISHLSEGRGALVVGHVIIGKFAEKVIETELARVLSNRSLIPDIGSKCSIHIYVIKKTYIYTHAYTYLPTSTYMYRYTNIHMRLAIERSPAGQ
jgi:hypothetical protein